jgi:hypothetical protein
MDFDNLARSWKATARRNPEGRARLAIWLAIAGIICAMAVLAVTAREQVAQQRIEWSASR